MTSAGTTRTSGPDVLKGALLVLVVFGHTIPESVDHSFTKWLIYGVHMPAFLFLSGYLIGVDSLRRRSFGEFARHYWRRMLLPWLVVSLIWGCTYGTFSRAHLLRSLTDLVLHPEWHLWYVPVLFAMLTLAWAAVRLDAAGAVLGGAAILGAAVWATPLAPHLLGGPADRFADERYFAYLVWFVLGLAVRNADLRVRGDARAVLTGAGVAGLITYLIAYWVDASGWAGALGFLAMNVAAALLLIPPLLAWLSRSVGADGFLAFAGRHSLWIYLLHPFVTEPVHDLDLPTLPQRLLALTVTAAVFGVVALARTQGRTQVIDLRDGGDRPPRDATETARNG